MCSRYGVAQTNADELRSFLRLILWVAPWLHPKCFDSSSIPLGMITCKGILTCQGFSHSFFFCGIASIASEAIHEDTRQMPGFARETRHREKNGIMFGLLGSTIMAMATLAASVVTLQRTKRGLMAEYESTMPKFNLGGGQWTCWRGRTSETRCCLINQFKSLHCRRIADNLYFSRSCLTWGVAVSKTTQLAGKVLFLDHC